eukprot:jgi/Mesen1/5863/ME000298S05125
MASLLVPSQVISLSSFSTLSSSADNATAKLSQPAAFVKRGSALKLSSRRSNGVQRGQVSASYGMYESNVRSERLWTPYSDVSGRDIWSIKKDVEVPHSPLMGGARANQGQPSPMLQERFQSVITQLFQNRIIRCGGAVDDDMANLIVAQLLYLDAADPNKSAGMAIFDTMRHIRPDVSTICVGLAASMGAFLLSSGTKGKRYSLPNSRIMIHQPLGGAQGQQTDIEIQANEILHHKANLNGYLAYHTGQSYEKITQEYGLIDAVISNPLKALKPLSEGQALPEPASA